MSSKNITETKNIYYITLIISNIILFLSIFLLIVHLIIPLFGGKLIILATLRYTGWLILALSLKLVIRRLQRGIEAGKKEYLLIYLATAGNIIFYTTYPSNIIINFLLAIILIYSYKKRSKNPAN